MSRYARWARAERSEVTRIAALALLGGPVFLGLIPFLVAGVGPRVDRRLGLPPPGIGPVRHVLGGAMTVLGFSLGFWSVDAQLTRGRGTPLPVMPTQELLTDGPFRYCRNPMTLGAILAYLGMAVAAGTTAGTALVLSLAASLLAYLKRLEEGELAERFGEAYLTYRRETPFIIPRLPKRQRTTTAREPAQRLVAGITRAMMQVMLRPILRAGVPVERQRMWLNRIGRLSPAPRGVEFRTGALLGGVRCDTATALAAATPDRAVLYLHGGGYCVGAPATHRPITGSLALRCAAKVYAADYRLAPEHPFPAAVDDAVAAYRGLLDERVAPSATVIAGDSAGGGLAVATALRLRDLGLPQPAALVLFSPWVDLTLAALGPAPSGDILSKAWIEECATLYLAGHSADDPLASPVNADLRGLPPTLIQVGGDELLLGDARRLGAALRVAGVDAELQEYPRRWHVFQQSAGALADADRALDAVAVFVGSRIGGPTGTP